MGSHHKDAKLKKAFPMLKPPPADNPYRYPTGRTYEWKPLKRNFWELRDLALLTRK